MFNKICREPIDFHSNPPLEDKIIVTPVLDEESGHLVNKLKSVPDDHRSPLDGCHFDAASMSLRAKLNFGIPLKQVPNVNIVSDPTTALHTLSGLEKSISDKVSDMHSVENSVVDSVETSES